MMPWVAAFSSIIGLCIFYYFIRRHTEKYLINKINLEQSRAKLKRINKAKLKELDINERYDKHKESLIKSNIIDWPDSGRIELPTENNRDSARITKA